MKNARLKNSVTYLFLVLFFSMKMAGLHALVHADHDKDHAIHCLICDQAIAHNLTPALTPEPQDFSIENIKVVAQKEFAISIYNFVVSSTLTKDQLFSRPPPFLL